MHLPAATPLERLLPRSDVLMHGIALLVAGVALRPVLRAFAQGRRVRPRDHRRVHLVAASPPHHVEALVVALLVVVVGSMVRSAAAEVHPDGGRPAAGRAATM